MLTIFTDGACEGNPGRGGWAWVRVEADGTVREECGGEPATTTNNRMELRAAIEALNALTTPAAVRLCSDSRYVVDGMTKWIANWKRRGWMTKREGECVLNRDLWMALDAAAARHRVEWRWVRGHDGHPQNEYANHLATRAAREQTSSNGLEPSRFDTWVTGEQDSGRVRVPPFPFPSRDTFRADPLLPPPPELHHSPFA